MNNRKESDAMLKSAIVVFIMIITSLIGIFNVIDTYLPDVPSVLVIIISLLLWAGLIVSLESC